MSRARAAAGLLAAAGLAAAEAPPAPVRVERQPEDSVVAAKRDLEAIKAGRATPETPRISLPALATPEFSAGAQALTRVPATKPAGSNETRKKSENWLVEAMQPRVPRHGDPSARAAGRPSDNPDGSVGADSDDPSATAEGISAEAIARGARGKFEQRPAPRERVEPIVNPLTHYMAGWMTPQDFKLLQPTLTAERDTTRGGRDEFAAILPLAGAGSTADRLPLGRTTTDASSRPPRENPFLAALVPAEPVVAAGIATPPAAPRPPVIVAPPAPTPPPVPASPKVPAFVKPLDDAKYFKPLKKF
jgi:hypothetical protein